MLLAAQLVDVVWAVLVLLGVERFHLDPTLASNPLVLDHMPYTHSLLAGAGWAILAGVVVVNAPRLGGTLRAAAVVALVVLSHWVLDLIVHRPDLTLAGRDPKLGLALWNAPSLAFALEVLLLAGAAGFYTAVARVTEPTRRTVVRGVLLLIALQTTTLLGPVPSSTTALVVTMVTTFLGIAWAAARAELRVAAGARRAD